MTSIDQLIANGPFQASLDSLRDYTVPAFGNEWYPRNMYLQGSEEFKHHIETYGPHTQFGCKDFIPLFKAEKYDPDHWTPLFKKAGARYVMPVAEHHGIDTLFISSNKEYGHAIHKTW